MCSLFGVLLVNLDNQRKRVKADRILNCIMNRSLARGRDGYGWKSSYNANYKDKYKAIPIDGDLGEIITPNLHAGITSIRRGTIIGNFRAEPTTEFVEVKQTHDQQPYSDGKWSVVHNGTIANDKELRTYHLSSKIDSAAIPEALNMQSQMIETCYGNYEHFKDVISKVKGSYAIMTTIDGYDNSILVAANYRPLWYANTDVGVFFASSREYFPEGLTPISITPYTSSLFYYDQKSKLHIITDNLQRFTPDQKLKALVIASGGLDSTIAAASCIKDGYDVELLHFKYGCRAENHEVDALYAIAEELGVKLKLFPLDIYDKDDSPLLNSTETISGGVEGAEFANEWVPARNLVMLSIATAYAEAKGFDFIVLGNNMEEAGAYPDNEPEFINRFNELLPFAVGDGKRVRVLMPVGDLMKHEIVALGYKLNAPMHLTWSCYKDGYTHCGECGPCFMRKTAFMINKLDEVINYEK